jgi:hypothetical protein
MLNKEARNRLAIRKVNWIHPPGHAPQRPAGVLFAIPPIKLIFHWYIYGNP